MCVCVCACECVKIVCVCVCLVEQEQMGPLFRQGAESEWAKGNTVIMLYLMVLKLCLFVSLQSQMEQCQLGID